LLPHGHRSLEREQTRYRLHGRAPLLVGEVVDDVGAARIVLADVVVIDGLLDETIRGDRRVDRRSGGVGLREQRLAPNLADPSPDGEALSEIDGERCRLRRERAPSRKSRRCGVAISNHLDAVTQDADPNGRTRPR
jgi:hypothetical protein